MVDPVTRERKPANATRHADDLYTWVQEQVALLRAGHFAEIDAEELSDLGRSEFAKLRSALRVLVMHMLKWDQPPEHRTASWLYSIREQRRRYHDVLGDNPGLRSRRDEALQRAYPDARDWAANETSLTPDEFPTRCPYTWDDILDRPFDLDSLKP